MRRPNRDSTRNPCSSSAGCRCKALRSRARGEKTPCYAQSSVETRHNTPLAFTMQQGPIPTQLCCGTSKLGGARRTRMKESHEVYEIRQGTSDERPLCFG